MSVINARVKKRYKVNLPEQLMECEFNYCRLLKLLPNIQTLPVNHSRQYIVGNSPTSENVIQFTLLEQTKYTSLVHIVQFSSLPNSLAYIQNKSHPIYCGDVRLYHDASVAEVVKCQRYHQFSPRYEYPNVDMHQIDEKVQMNRFLGELLAHCLSHGRISEAITSQLVTK